MVYLSERFNNWLSQKAWRLHPHQIEMLETSQRPAQLLIAPTGAGKTLAGFLPSLCELETTSGNGLHTLYISPLKALAADIKRNLMLPIGELGLQIGVEDRTGDTSSHVKRRQRAAPPDILLTTPESLAILTSYEDAPRIFAGLQRVIVDEIHALYESKRGDQLMLALSRILGLVPDLRRVAELLLVVILRGIRLEEVTPRHRHQIRELARTSHQGQLTERQEPRPNTEHQ